MQHVNNVSMRTRHQHDSGAEVKVSSAVWSLETWMCMRTENTDCFTVHCIISCSKKKKLIEYQASRSPED